MEQPTSDPKLSCQLRDQAGNVYKLFDKLWRKQILEASKANTGNSMLRLYEQFGNALFDGLLLFLVTKAIIFQFVQKSYSKI